MDYLLKAEAVRYFGRGEPLVRFFGLFYAATGVSAVLIESTIGRAVLVRLGLGGSVATHPVIVGTAALSGFVVPFAWWGVLPRGLDIAIRNSIFRAGYELRTRRWRRRPSGRPSPSSTWRAIAPAKEPGPG